MSRRKSRSPLNACQRLILATLRKLGGAATILELRFATKFFYKSGVMTANLRALTWKGYVRYIRLLKPTPWVRGHWELLQNRP